jgi:hypothetical protein
MLFGYLWISTDMIIGNKKINYRIGQWIDSGYEWIYWYIHSYPPRYPLKSKEISFSVLKRY